MLKSLSARAIIPVTISVTGFVVVCSILLYAIMKADMTSDVIRYETNQALTIVKSTRYAMLHDDRESLRNIIDNIGTQENVEHVRIFNKRGLIMFSSDPAETGRLLDKKAAGCVECHSGPVPSATLGDMKQARRFVNEKGKDVIAITAPIYNEPSCYQAACHIHKAEQKILGTLDIGLSTASLVDHLAVMRSRMVVFSVMVLLVTVGGVAALLRRTVFIPLRLLADFTEKTIAGVEQEIPSARGTEIEAVAGPIRNRGQD
ncbi:MAG: HAMP domain-containing protein, partial [Thermodesulfobacteriota bacterium]